MNNLWASFAHFDALSGRVRSAGGREGDGRVRVRLPACRVRRAALAVANCCCCSLSLSLSLSRFPSLIYCCQMMTGKSGGAARGGGGVGWTASVAAARSVSEGFEGRNIFGARCSLR